MKKSIALGLAVSLAIVAAATAQAPRTASHILTVPRDITWGDPPPVFEKGMAFTVISGDPGKPGLYVVRAKMPAGYKIAPHWHPTDEHVTILSGTFAFGMGDKLDAAT